MSWVILNYFYSYMSQPKNQLETFKAWAGRDSDISYYLNSHHVDVCLWMTQGRAVPTKVTASGSKVSLRPKDASRHRRHDYSPCRLCDP